MRRLLFLSCCLLTSLLPSTGLRAQARPQTDADAYTRYELLAPASHSFRILYDISATTPGARYYFNTLRPGSDHQVDAVYDLMTGQKLQWAIVKGSEAQQLGHPEANPVIDYLQAFLPRPVPENGEVRLRIDKTYSDTASYYQQSDRIVFERPLSIRRNAVVLPAGYELVSCNFPSQISREADGRIRMSFSNPGPAPVPYRVEARKLPASAMAALPKRNPRPWPEEAGPPEGRNRSKARLDYQVSERAFQDREIVYYLQQPETHAFRLYHDYTESRPGTDKYLNVVRAGSKASNPEAYILDTGEKLKVETLKGEAIRQKNIDIGQEILPETEVVVIWFDPVKANQSVRLRIWETYTDPNRYLLYNGELIWDRAFGRPRNTVVLPEGWYLTASSIPGVVSTLLDGRIQIHFENDRPDEIEVFIKAQRRGN